MNVITSERTYATPQHATQALVRALTRQRLTLDDVR